MNRGEVWWADVDERCPVVFLTPLGGGTARAILVVPPAEQKLDRFVEIAIGGDEGLPFEGVVRIAFPQPGFIPCHWLTTISVAAFRERAGTLSAAKLRTLDEALRRAGLE